MVDDVGRWPSKTLTFFMRDVRDNVAIFDRRGTSPAATLQVLPREFHQNQQLNMHGIQSGKTIVMSSQGTYTASEVM